MGLKLRALQKHDLEPVTQIGFSAWVQGIAPLIDDISARDLVQVENVFRAFLLTHLDGQSCLTDHLACADLGGQAIGFYNLDFSSSELTDLWVMPQWQGQGIAALLLQDAKHVARQSGLSQLKLKVLADNLRAIAFYRKYGFAEENKTVCHDGLLRRDLETLTMSCILDE